MATVSPTAACGGDVVRELVRTEAQRGPGRRCRAPGAVGRPTARGGRRARVARGACRTRVGREGAVAGDRGPSRAASPGARRARTRRPRRARAPSSATSRGCSRAFDRLHRDDAARAGPRIHACPRHAATCLRVAPRRAGACRRRSPARRAGARLPVAPSPGSGRARQTLTRFPSTTIHAPGRGLPARTTRASSTAGRVPVEPELVDRELVGVRRLALLRDRPGRRARSAACSTSRTCPERDEARAQLARGLVRLDRRRHATRRRARCRGPPRCA